MKGIKAALPRLLRELYDQLENMKRKHPAAFGRYAPLHAELEAIQQELAASGAMNAHGTPVIQQQHQVGPAVHLKVMSAKKLPKDDDATLVGDPAETTHTYVVGPWPPGPPVSKCPNCGQELG